jgi:rhodanese-related sulfurtransferase
VFAGMFVFALLVGWLPALDALYHAGDMGTSLLPDVFRLPAPVLVVAVVLVATAGFVVAERVEAHFAMSHPDREVELTPRTLPQMKLAVTGVVALIALFGVTALERPAAERPPVAMAALDPLALARSIIARDPNIIVLDVRTAHATNGDAEEKPIPGAVAAFADSAAPAALDAAVPATTVVIIYDESGTLREVPATWRRDVAYRFLDGGYHGWQQRVLTPATAQDTRLDSVASVREQNQIAAYFSGASVEATPVAAPPPVVGGGGVKKKKAGGC